MAAVDRRRVVVVGGQCRLFVVIIDSLLNLGLGQAVSNVEEADLVLGDTVGKFVPMHSAIIDDR